MNYHFLRKSLILCVHLDQFWDFFVLSIIIEYQITWKAVKLALERSVFSLQFGLGFFVGDYSFISSISSRSFFQESVYQKIKAFMQSCWEEK